MKIFNLFIAFIFMVFAGLQFNDDPADVWFWVFIYASVGLISAFAAFDRYNMWVILLGIGIVLYKMFIWFPALAQWIGMGTPSIVGEMEASTPYVETTREFLGLFICLIVLIYHYIGYMRLKKNIHEDFGT